MTLQMLPANGSLVNAKFSLEANSLSSDFYSARSIFADLGTLIQPASSQLWNSNFSYSTSTSLLQRANGMRSLKNNTINNWNKSSSEKKSALGITPANPDLQYLYIETKQDKGKRAVPKASKKLPMVTSPDEMKGWEIKKTIDKRINEIAETHHTRGCSHTCRLNLKTCQTPDTSRCKSPITPAIKLVAATKGWKPLTFFNVFKPSLMNF